MKKLISVVMLLVMVCSMAFPAAADEMAVKYTDCLSRLNNYLLNAEGAYVDLNQLQKDLDALGNYSNGECALLSKYTQVLINLRDARYVDCEMYLLLLLNNAQKVDSILYAHPEYSAIGSVSALKAYYDARVYEAQGNYNAAFDLYSITSMLDSLSRAQYCYDHRSVSASFEMQNSFNGQSSITSSDVVQVWPIGAKVKIVKAGNVRKGPGTNYSRIDGVGIGSSFEILDCQEGSNGNDWYQIKVSGKLGWISETLTEIKGGSSSGSNEYKNSNINKNTNIADAENKTKVENEISNENKNKNDSESNSAANSSSNNNVTSTNVNSQTQNTTINVYYPKEEKWSAWSAWSTTPVSSSSTRDVDTKIEYEPIYVTKYHYRHWKYYNTSAKAYWYSYSEYKGTNYKKDSGKWEYKTTTSPLKKKTVIDGRQQYEGYWYLYDTTTEQNGTKAITYYRYRDKLN